MCGRFVSTKKPQEIADEFEVDEIRTQDNGISYNVAPTEQVWIVNEHDDQRLIDRFIWGLIPTWAKDRSIGPKMINARAEEVNEKPAYKNAFAKRRCLIPADGFYEWKKEGSKRQPYYFSLIDGSEMAFAGLWEGWKDKSQKDSEWLHTCTIITTEANEIVQPVHDRMPVLLPRSSWKEWLDKDNDDIDDLKKMLKPAPDQIMQGWPVTTRVNKAGESDPSFIEEEGEDPTKLF